MRIAANAAAMPRNLSVNARSMALTVVYDKARRTVLEQVEVTGQEVTADSETPHWLLAVRAAQEKQAEDIMVLDLTGITSVTDHCVICTGNNNRQVQAISDEINFQLKKVGDLPVSLEGYEGAEWVLADYGDFLVHVFSPKSREYYALERLWKAGKVVEIPAA